MTGRVPDDDRSRRRALAKLHHPDRGGDPVAFDRAMRETAATPSPSARPGRDPHGTSDTRVTHEIVFTPSPRTRLRRRVATARDTVGTQVLRWARLTRRAP